MKKILLGGLLFVLATVVVVAQNLPSITIVNNTGYEIFYVHMSPVEDEFFGEDWLGEDTIRNGASKTFQLNIPLNTANRYDILLEDEEGDYYVKMEVTITNNARIVFTQDDLDDD
ncbi:MAG: hypothetical protein FWG29_11370 [Treponema sp.]|nr:hypothetical protein [Treponema sp.]